MPTGQPSPPRTSSMGETAATARFHSVMRNSAALPVPRLSTARIRRPTAASGGTARGVRAGRSRTAARASAARRDACSVIWAACRAALTEQERTQKAAGMANLPGHFDDGGRRRGTDRPRRCLRVFRSDNGKCELSHESRKKIGSILRRAVRPWKWNRVLWKTRPRRRPLWRVSQIGKCARCRDFSPGDSCPVPDGNPGLDSAAVIRTTKLGADGQEVRGAPQGVCVERRTAAG